MTALEFNIALVQSGLTRKDFAALSGHNERTVRRYCNGEVDIPKPIEIIIKRAVEDNWGEFGEAAEWRKRIKSAQAVIDDPANSERRKLIARKNLEIASRIYEDLKTRESVPVDA